MRFFAAALRDMWLGLRLVLVIWPLRMVTGRRYPDYKRISQLELECGLREPTTAEVYEGRRGRYDTGLSMTMANVEQNWMRTESVGDWRLWTPKPKPRKVSDYELGME